MSHDDDLGPSGLLFLGLIIFVTYSCNKKPIEETEEYQAGYSAGRIDGQEEGKAAGKNSVCNEAQYYDFIYNGLTYYNICD